MRHKNIKNNYGIPSLLLRFLGTCVYGDPIAYYDGLSEADRAELNAQGRTFDMTAWFYRYLCNVLSEEQRLAYQRVYQARQIKALIGARELRRFYGVLTSHGLRFTPIKGADLAYRIYPDAALRDFCDWDILFHPDDCEHALAVLAEDGWKVSEVTSTNLDIDQMKGKHHFLGHVRGHYKIEPHFTLANFEGIDPHEIWKKTLSYPDGDGQHVLSPEMNILMLTRHAATKSYFHANLPKLLVDTAMVIKKEKVNFDEIRKLANSWNLPYPGNLLAAFPEFFLPDIITDFKSDSKCTDAFRQIFEMRGKLGEQDNASLRLGRLESQDQILGGVLRYVYTLRASKIRHIYRLPKHGAWGRVIKAYIKWGWTCIWNARTWIRRNPFLREYGHFVETVESSQKR